MNQDIERFIGGLVMSIRENKIIRISKSHLWASSSSSATDGMFSSNSNSTRISLPRSLIYLVVDSSS